MRCEICGTDHEQPGRFCSECGFPLHGDAAARARRRQSLTERLGPVKLGAALGAALVVLAMSALAIVGAAAGGDGDEATASQPSEPAAAAQQPEEEGEAPDRPVTERARAVDSGTVQKQIGVGETATDDGVTFKVTRIGAAESIPLYGTSGEILRVPGEKLVRVDVRWRNNMEAPADLFCAGARNAVLLDVAGENYTPLRSSFDAEGNEDVCDEPVEPGSKQDVRLFYRLEEGTAVEGVVLWNAAAPDDPDGDATDVFVEAI